MSNSLHDLLGIVAFPETPEERDAAWSTIEAVMSRVEAVAAGLEKRGNALEEKGNNGSIYAQRAEGRGIGYREGARLIRAALATG